MAYEHLANLPDRYGLGEKDVQFDGLVTDPSLVLKQYQIYDSVPLDSSLVKDSKKFLKGEISAGRINPYLGLGFAILSKDMFNVARWDTTHPIVLQNQIYSFNNGDLGNAHLLDIREIGTFCIWELGIVNHEREAWFDYLVSLRREQDKKNYLDSVVRSLF
ncbi:MAG: hypothetical protein Q8Q01_04145 [archaeon]|nr:hypothetical protein [archaeon]